MGVSVRLSRNARVYLPFWIAIPAYLIVGIVWIGIAAVMVMVWLPGQETPIHDHLAWCVTGVMQGGEYEEIYATDGEHLSLVTRNRNAVGAVSAFAPPGDIHRVRNDGAGVAISMHVYGTDISRVGSSVRRVYDLPVR